MFDYCTTDRHSFAARRRSVHGYIHGRPCGSVVSHVWWAGCGWRWAGAGGCGYVVRFLLLPTSASSSIIVPGCPFDHVDVRAPHESRPTNTIEHESETRAVRPLRPSSSHIKYHRVISFIYRRYRYRMHLGRYNISLSHRRNIVAISYFVWTRSKRRCPEVSRFS